MLANFYNCCNTVFIKFFESLTAWICRYRYRLCIRYIWELDLNTAQASHKLGNPWNCFVARFTNFNQIVDQLRKGYPVVVSVKGPLKGSALPYESRHLLVVKGYDSKKQEVFCMDPAFSANELTHVTYALDDFLVAWGRRKGIAYVFDQ